MSKCNVSLKLDINSIFRLVFAFNVKLLLGGWIVFLLGVSLNCVDIVSEIEKFPWLSTQVINMEELGEKGGDVAQSHDKIPYINGKSKQQNDKS